MSTKKQVGIPGTVDLVVRITKRPTFKNARTEKILADLDEKARQEDQQLFLPMETRKMEHVV